MNRALGTEMAAGVSEAHGGRRARIAAALGVTLALALATPSLGATYCVDVNWTNSPGAGTTNNPFDTIMAAVAAANGNAGSTILVADGLYSSLLSGGKEDFGTGGDSANVGGSAVVLVTGFGSASYISNCVFRGNRCARFGGAVLMGPGQKNWGPTSWSRRACCATTRRPAGRRSAKRSTGRASTGCAIA